MLVLTQPCLTLCNPWTVCSLPGSSVHGILQARILEWVAMPSSRGSSQPRDQTHHLRLLPLAGRFFTTAPPCEPSELYEHKRERARMCLGVQAITKRLMGLEQGMGGESCWIGQTGNGGLSGLESK